MDWIYGDVTSLVTFLQNHDVGPDNDFKFRFKGEQWMAAAAYNLIWTARGIPCLYYGEEIEFMKGAPQDVEGENDTLDQTGRAYFGDHLTDERIGETQSHPLYRHLQRLNQIRRAVPALQKAPMTRVAEWGSGMSFVRDLSEQGELRRGRARHRRRPADHRRWGAGRPLPRRRDRPRGTGAAAGASASRCGPTPPASMSWTAPARSARMGSGSDSHDSAEPPAAFRPRPCGSSF